MSTSDICKICKDSASKSNNDVCGEVNDMLQNMCTDDDNVLSVCANCGKEGDDVNNSCNKCKMVKYCNAVCKKKHQHKHKKECEEHLKLAAEHAAELHDEKLFKHSPPQYGDCPICFLLLPTLTSGWRYMVCCGKTICSGCLHAPLYDNEGNEVDIVKQNECAFCRVVAPYTIGEAIEREKKRLEKDDPIAIYNIGNYYRDRRNGFPQDYTKALELYHRAAELGYAMAYTNIGVFYYNGYGGVDIDKEKAKHYFELAAMKGDASARYNLGNTKKKAGNIDRAIKHYMIAVRAGYSDSLKQIQKMYSNGQATKEDYTKALESYQEYLADIKSKQRDEAAAFHEDYRYY